MKNIHLIPTDKPSTEYILGKCIKKIFDIKIGQFVKSHYMFFSKEYFQPHNIYITSDEEIKEGDWHFKNDKMVTKSHIIDDTCKKIILTTDADLIADGVQSIQDDFIEWFVDNPKCESVKVISLRKSSGHYDEKEIWHWDFLGYKLIIPKEEPKQETLENFPTELESVLAKISHQNDLGLSQWYEVVYYADDRWCSYSGSKTFQDGEKVVEWVYCKNQFKNR